jgi:hypothetical protein
MSHRSAILLLCLSGAILYGRVATFPFFNLDDYAYLHDNPFLECGLTPVTILRVLGSSLNGMWHPLTVGSFILESKLVGLSPWGYHVTNAVLHVLNTCLVLQIIRSLGVRTICAFMFSFAFLVHPLNVESAAWISERKGLLATMFALFTCQTWLSYLRTKVRRFYWWTLCLFILGCMAKTTIVTVPFVLMLLEWFDGSTKVKTLKMLGGLGRATICLLGRYGIFLIIAAGMIAGSVLFQREIQDQSPSILFRVTNVVLCFAVTAIKVVVPIQLAVLYPRPLYWEPTLAIGAYGFCVVAFWILWRLISRWRFVGLSAGWFVVAIAPTAGLVPYGPHWIADRNAYFALVGVMIGCAISYEKCVPKMKPIYCRWLVTLGCISLACLAVMGQRQMTLWANPIALWTRAIEVSPDNPFAYANLGGALARQGFRQVGLDAAKYAVCLMPFSPRVHVSAGWLYSINRRVNRAEWHFIEACRLEKDGLLGKRALGTFYINEKRFLDAERVLRALYLLVPDDGHVASKLSFVMFQLGRPSEARALANEAVEKTFGCSVLVLENQYRLALARRDTTDCKKAALALEARLASRWGKAQRELLDEVREYLKQQSDNAGSQ